MHMTLRSVCLFTAGLATTTSGQVAASASASPPVSDAGMNLWDLIIQGGWCMWPLGGCSLAMLVLIIHATRETRRARFVPEEVLSTLGETLQRRDLGRAGEMLAASRTVLARVLAVALERARPEMPDANKARIEERIAEGIEHEDATIGQWINYLNVVATIAPMVGLLGTVSGMIGAFQTISSGGMGRPELLAGDIGEALITTAAGLIIGIPAMLAYFILRNRLGNQIAATVQVATHLVGRLAGDAAPAE
jgi:biopolymer transport protein ExbB